MLLENLKLTEENKRRVGIVIVMSICILIIMCNWYFVKTSNRNLAASNKKEAQSVAELQSLKSFSNNLNDITIKLNKIEQSLVKPTVNIEPIQRQISDLAHETEALNKESKEVIGEVVNTATRDLNEKLSNIEAELFSLKEKQKKSVFVKESNLPFKVLHIDNIQGNNVTTIRYNNTIFPITEGEYLAGWKLVKSEFNKQETEFVNENQEHILVSLNFNHTTSEVS